MITYYIVFQTFEKRDYNQWNVHHQGYNSLPQVPANVNRNNEERNNTPLRYYGDGRVEPQGIYPINHHLWNMYAHQQALIQRHQSEKQKQYEMYLLKKQEAIKKHLELHEKMLREKMFRKNVVQRSKFLQRLYYDHLLHREYDENEIETQTKKSEET